MGVSIEISPDGIVDEIEINEFKGERVLVDEVISIIKKGEPYVEVVEGFSQPLKFKLYFQVGDI